MRKATRITDSNFLLIIIGQTISLLGNGIIRFALPLYLLQVTGSSAIFGMVSAISFIPLILLMPIGGVIADRVNKRKVMVLLDFLTGILMLTLYFLLGKVELVPLLILVLMTLYSLNGLEQPTAQASIPVVLDESCLVQGNSLVSSIGALANLFAPILAGFLFGIYGIYPIILVSMVCFFLTAFLELFIKIPFEKNSSQENFWKIIKVDISVAGHFIFKEKRIIMKLVLLTCVLNAFISSLLIISTPVLITNRLNLSEEFYGISQGILALGGLSGGILTGVLDEKIKIEKIHKMILFLVLSLLPLGMVPLLIEFKFLSYALILLSSFLVMSLATVVSIQIMTYVQKKTPEKLLGKVMSLLITLSICSQPIGQIFYGFAFEMMIGQESMIILVSILIALSTSFYAKRIFQD